MLQKKRTATEQFHSELRFQSLPNSSTIIPFKSKLYIIKGRGNMILLVAEHFVCLSYIPSRTYWLLAEKSFISGNYNSSQLKMFLKHEQAFIFHEMYLMRQAGNWSDRRRNSARPVKNEWIGISSSSNYGSARSIG